MSPESPDCSDQAKTASLFTIAVSWDYTYTWEKWDTSKRPTFKLDMYEYG